MKKDIEQQKDQTLDIGISELEQCETKAQEYLDGWKRAQADFLNYKKDELKRVGQLVHYQTEGILEDVVGIADIFDSAFKAIPVERQEQNKQWLEGIGYVRKQIDEVLKKNGVTKIQVEDTFDPTIHEAIDSETEGSQIEEVRAGYRIGERILRPARVSFKKVNK